MVAVTDSQIIRTVHPCCGTRVRLAAVPNVPRERYDRRCPVCHWHWTVTRTLLHDRDGVRMDRLDWEQEPAH